MRLIHCIHSSDNYCANLKKRPRQSSHVLKGRLTDVHHFLKMSLHLLSPNHSPLVSVGGLVATIAKSVYYRSRSKQRQVIVCVQTDTLPFPNFVDSMNYVLDFLFGSTSSFCTNSAGHHNCDCLLFASKI